MRQAGLFCLGEGSRDMCDDKKKVTEELLRKVEEGTKKEPDTKKKPEVKKNTFLGRLPK